MCHKSVITNYACVCQEVGYVHVSHDCMHVIVVRAQTLCVCHTHAQTANILNMHITRMKSERTFKQGTSVKG